MRDFISLNGVLNSILNKFELPEGFGIASPYKDWGKVSSEAGNLFWESIQPRFNYTYKLSVASSALNEVLHDSPPVRCFEFDLRKTFAVEADVLGEIKEILTDATGFHGKFYTACMEQFKKAITEGDEELRNPVNFPIHFCEQSHPTGFLKDSLLGFSFGELNRLLEDYISGNPESKIAQLLGKITESETVGDDSAGRQDGAEPAGIKSIEPSRNDFEWSGLLKIPNNAGNWGFAIDDMTRNFYQKNSRLPNKAEAWGQLCTNPPHGYSITVGTDKRLYMPAADPLTKRAFNDRWKRYTEKT